MWRWWSNGILWKYGIWHARAGTFPSSNSTTYVAGGINEHSGNGGLNNLGAPPVMYYQSGTGGAGGGPTLGSYGCGGNGAFSPFETQLNGSATRWPSLSSGIRKQRDREGGQLPQQHLCGKGYPDEEQRADR